MQNEPSEERQKFLQLEKSEKRKDLFNCAGSDKSIKHDCTKTVENKWRAKRNEKKKITIFDESILLLLFQQDCKIALANRFEIEIKFVNSDRNDEILSFRSVWWLDQLIKLRTSLHVFSSQMKLKFSFTKYCIWIGRFWFVLINKQKKIRVKIDFFDSKFIGDFHFAVFF